MRNRYLFIIDRQTHRNNFVPDTTTKRQAIIAFHNKQPTFVERGRNERSVPGRGLPLPSIQPVSLRRRHQDLRPDASEYH